MIELGEVGEDGEPVRAAALRHVRGVEQRGDPELLLRDPEHRGAVPDAKSREYE